MVGVVIFAGLWMWAGERNKMLWITDWLPHWPWWSALFWGPAALFVWYLFDHFTSWGFTYGISVVIWRIIWLLSLPKAGIVGTLGLLIAVADNLLS